ncbi:MAG: hypothetical protein AAGG01_20935, partial [Planctomycetota bacterium]
GGSGTSRFLQSLAGSLPPTLQMMKDIGGVEMPEFLGKLVAGDGDGNPSNTATDEPLAVAAGQEAREEPGVSQSETDRPSEGSEDSGDSA